MQKTTAIAPIHIKPYPVGQNKQAFHAMHWYLETAFVG